MENYKRKANLFIVGAMKAGTTSFTNTLAQHPHIYFSPIKEPNFFVNELPEKIYTPSIFFSVEKYFKKDFPKPLHIAHVKEELQYETLFSNAMAHHKYLSEGSTTYLHAPESAEKIYAYNPHAKIIILIRNGLNRALSHYKMDKGLGRTAKTFKEVLTEDMMTYQNKTLSNWSYLGMSLYAENIYRYKSIFKENVLVIHFEDLVTKEEEISKKIFSFLELDYMAIKLIHTNESFHIRFSKPLNWLYKTGIKDLFSYMLPLRIRHKAFDLLKTKSSSNVQLTDSFKRELQYLFEEDILKIK